MEYFFTLERDLPPGVGFPLFGRDHLCWLAISASVTVLLCLAALRLGDRGRRRLRAALGCAALLCEGLKDLNLLLQGAMSVYFLPLHLCGLAVFFTFFHSLRPGAVLGNFLYSTCMPGAAFALLFPDWTMYPPFSYHSLVGFAVHTLLVAYPLTLLAAGTLRPAVGALPGCLALLAALAAVIYPIDRAWNANYMFLLFPAPGSPLEWFAALLGNPGYLLGCLPMLGVVWGLLYLPFLPRKPRDPGGNSV